MPVRSRTAALVNWRPAEDAEAGSRPLQQVLNDGVEQDHRLVKQRIRPMLGSAFDTEVTISGIELVPKIRKHRSPLITRAAIIVLRRLNPLQNALQCIA